MLTYFFRFDSPGTTCEYENGHVGGFATAEGGNAIARYGVGEAKRHGPLSVRGASAQVKVSKNNISESDNDDVIHQP